MPTSSCQSRENTHGLERISLEGIGCGFIEWGFREAEKGRREEMDEETDG